MAVNWGSMFGNILQAIPSFLGLGNSSGNSGSSGGMGGEEGGGYDVGSGKGSGSWGAGKVGNGLYGALNNNYGGKYSGTSFPGQVNQASSVGGSSNWMPSGGQSGGGGAGGVGGLLSGIFGQNASAGSVGKSIGQFVPGLAGMFGAQQIKNPAIPQLPQSFQNFQNQALQGGPPIQQQSNQYLSTLMSGQNTAANDAATHSLDLNYQEQLRQLNGMYKSLRPGTDPTSDTTYQRDLSNLNDQYTRQRAQVLAQQQMGAAQQGQQAGAEQAQQQLAAVETQVNQIAQQWQMDYAQKEALRSQLMQQAGLQMAGPVLGGIANMFGQGMKGA